MGLGEILEIPLSKIPYVKEWSWLKYAILKSLLIQRLTKAVLSTSKDHGDIFEKQRRN
jgi:hypothetical protein